MKKDVPTMGDWVFCQIMGLLMIFFGCVMIMGGISVSTQIMVQENLGIELISPESREAVSADFFWIMGFWVALCSFFFFFRAGNILVEIEKEKHKPKLKEGNEKSG